MTDPNSAPIAAATPGPDRLANLAFRDGPVPTLVVGPGAIVRAVNRAAAELLERSPEAVVGRGIESFSDPADPRSEALLGALTGGRPWSGELDVLLPAQRLLPVEARLAAAQDEAGMGVLTLADIRLRRETDERLRARARQHALVARLSEQALRGVPMGELLGAATGGLWRALGVDGVALWVAEHPSGTLRLAAAEGLSGPGSEVEAVPMSSWPGFVLARARPVTVPDFRAESRFEPDPTHTRWGMISGAAVPVGVDRGGWGVLSVYGSGHRGFTVQEIHLLQAVAGLIATVVERARGDRERDELQQQVLQAQRLETVGRLAGGLAHDFNNLMAVVLSSVGLVLPELEQGTDLWEDAEQIQAAARRAAALTGDLLLYAGRDVGEPRVVRFDAVLADLLRILRRAAGETVHVELEVADGVWPVKVDPSRLEQVLMNLVVNARDAMGTAEGTIHISLGNVHVDDAPAVTPRGLAEGAWVRLAVSDEGVGVPAALLERIFEPLFSTKEPGHGTGLGLATVRAVVEAAGGTVEVESAPGQGSTFILWWPAAEDTEVWEDESPPVVESADSLRGHGERVLLVDDEPMVRRAVRRMLERGGYEVVEAGDGQGALDRLRDEAAGLALLLADVAMPGMGGRELRRRVGMDWPELPCVLMTAWHVEATDDAATVLRKPFEASELLSRVRQLVAGPPDGSRGDG